MAMTWHDLLFAHWPLPTEALAPLLPDGVELDLFDGEAWLGIVPFRMSGVRLRRLPPLPGTGAFPELNVRTYVRAGGKPGVWFFSLDARSALAVAIARAWFRLPYHRGLLRGEIAHARWPLQSAEAEITTNTMTAPLGFTLPARAPLLHFAGRLDVVAWSPEPV
jgi:uncharacterized protein YqjF (DUF2071 family)